MANRLVVILLLAVPLGSVTGQDRAVERAFRDYWLAQSPQQAERARDRILESGVTFETAWSRLKAGRTYSDAVETGRLDLSRRNANGVTFHYTVFVPADYDPGRRYPVRVYLHGGVDRPAWEAGDAWWWDYEPFVSSEWISVFPSAWYAAMWWQASQVENLLVILDRLKRAYNVDENRIAILGISDGGTGVYFQAFRHTTPWAAFLPFISHPSVLGADDVDVDGQMYVANLTNKPLLVVNGGMDPLYPAASVAPYIDLFRRGGADVLFRPQPSSGHDGEWWPAEEARIDSFIQASLRDPLPDRIVWETERTDRYQRAHWMLITELAPVVGDRSPDALNTIVSIPPLSLGIEPHVQSTRGVLVLRVEAGSVADSAGVLPGDFITEVKGVTTPTLQTLSDALQGVRYGDSVGIVLRRKNDDVTTTLRFPDGQPSARQAFPRMAPSGRLVLQRRENTVMVASRGVRKFTLLLSPDEFDFAAPVTVITNGVQSFNGLVTPDARTLLKWAAWDNDRTMLFGAELEIDVKMPD